MRKGICLLLIICCNITFIGCRKAADRGRSTHVRTETSKKDNKQVCVRNKKKAESVKKSDTPLSGSEIFKRYENAFGFNQAAGGVLGVTVIQGIKRGLFSNEAGEGSAPCQLHLRRIQTASHRRLQETL